MLYGVENWILCGTSLQKLEKFQGEMAKRILKLPKWFSNTAAKIALGWHSMHSICTIRKLKYLSRMMALEDGISHRAFCSLVDDVESLCLVKECRELEGRYGVDFTSKMWISPPKFSPLIQKRDDPSSRILCKQFTLKIWHFSCGRPQKQSIYARLLMLLVGRNSGTMPLIMVKRISPLFGIWYVSSAIRNMRSPHVHYVKQQNLTYHYRPIL